MRRAASLDSDYILDDGSSDSDVPRELMLETSSKHRQKRKLAGRRPFKPPLRQGFSTTALLKGKLGYSQSYGDPGRAELEFHNPVVSAPKRSYHPGKQDTIDETPETFGLEECGGPELSNGGSLLSRRRAIHRRTNANEPGDPPFSDESLAIDSTKEEENELLTVRSKEPKPDPFQFFEVGFDRCHKLSVRILCGRNISKGMLGDLVDTPDPYIIVHIRDAPDGKKQSKQFDNETNPCWDEELVYYLPPCTDADTDKKIIAEIKLMDANYAMDETMGSVEYDVAQLPLNETIKKTFNFSETSEVDFEFRKEIKCDFDIRYSLALCPEEKDFRSARKSVVRDAMNRIMVGGPRKIRETPTIAILGSGGGFRAVTGYSGAIKALHDMGLLQCATYVAGLSGSSWYLATLYAHDDFPRLGPDRVNEEIRHNIESSPFWLLRPDCLMRYSQRLHAKMKSGQPVTFTDFFGLLIGQTLLGHEKMETAKLTDFREKIAGGQAPMPILTCLHVRPNTSAMTFHDWIEFSPYEIGMPKYGSFMSTKYFGSKFFMGVLVKQFDESPLHFLMGVWGSAFSILFNRLVEKSKGLAPAGTRNEDFRQELEKELDQTWKADGKGAAVDEDSDEDYTDEDEDEDEYEDPEVNIEQIKAAQESRRNTWFAHNITEEPKLAARSNDRRPSMIASLFGLGGGKDQQEKPRKDAPKKPGKGFFGSIISNVFSSHFMESRDNRAGKILNYMRGLSLNQTYPLSPFTPLTKSSTIAEAGEFQKIHEPMEVRRKKVHLVDAGLTFNSPYPATLRPQRAVDLIISFDFSGRPEDNCEPFKEILLAEKWARMHHLPFPKIDRTVYEKEGMKECYVFKDDTNEKAPTIIHFVLCNMLFKEYSAPGVKREPGDTRGDFSIFDQQKTPYSTFNFQYSNEAFDRLNTLIEFNTRLHKDTILEEIRNCITLRRHSRARCSITLSDIRNSLHLTDKNKQQLETIISRESSGSIHLG